jgi:hypothetical protein
MDQRNVIGKRDATQYQQIRDRLPTQIPPVSRCSLMFADSAILTKEVTKPSLVPKVSEAFPTQQYAARIWFMYPPRRRQWPPRVLC